MEPERKRLFDGVDSSQLGPSKKPMHKLSEEGPLTQQDVVYFKKEAIWRQMNYYKLQANELNREIAKYEKRYPAFIAVHLLLDSWYKLVVLAYKKDDQLPPSLDLTLDEKEIETLLEERRQTLLSILLSSDSSTLEENLLKCSDIVTLKAEKEKAELLLQDLKAKIGEMELQLDEALRENDRKDSKTLQRLSNNNHIKPEEPERNHNGLENGTKSEVAGKANAADHAQQHELESLKIEFAELKASNESLEERLETALSNLSQAEETSNQLTQRLHDLDESDLNRSRRYLALVDHKNALAQTVAQITQVKEELINKLRQFDEKEGNFIRGVSLELEEENQRLKDLLTKAETDLVRVRTVRDELLGKHTVLKLEVDSKAANEELAKANELLNQRLKSLEEQRQKEADDGDNYTDKNLELLEKPELIKRLRVLNEELKDIEKAFQSTREINLAKLRDVVDREGLMKKLTIEKNKADQKYFASMRLKDLLVAENKVLKSQVAKSQELVNKLGEVEKAYASKVDILTKNVDEYRVIKKGSLQENAKLQETIKKLTKVRELATKDVRQLKEDLARTKKEKEDALFELGAQKTKESMLEAKLRATEHLLAKYKQNNTSSILQEDEKQLEALRSITKCSVCSKNWKNTAITACGHVFCDGCVQERLAARLRRCPTCNKGFSSNDLLSIHL